MAVDVDRQYLYLLIHLRRPSPAIPVKTVESATPHYLSQLSFEHVTSFTATVLSSAIWQPASNSSISSCSLIFRNAVHLKLQHLETKPKGIFSRSTQTRLRQWLDAVLKGAREGNRFLRAALLGGLAVGFNEITTENKQLKYPASLEDELLVALAEVLDVAVAPSWGGEFQRGQGKQDLDSLSTILLTDFLLFVPESKWHALDLDSLAKCCINSIQKAFQEGKIIRQITVERTNEGLCLSAESQKSIQAITSSTTFTRVAAFSRILARLISVTADVLPSHLWDIISHISIVLLDIARSVESDWAQSPLSGVTTDDAIASDSQASATAIWTIFKTLLFVDIMVSQSVLDALLYIRPPASTAMTTSGVTQDMLKIFSSLSFVVSKFGGVTSQSGLTELRRAVYTAVDLLAADPNATEEYVVQEYHALQRFSDPRNLFAQSKASFAIAIIEQLVPVLSESTLETHVVPMCTIYLDRNEERETYEASHSLVLSIFAAHAKQRTEEALSEASTGRLVERLVPFYCECLLKNSSEGKLSTEQLRLAYSSLVHSASEGRRFHDELSQFCIESLTNKLAESSASSTKSPGETERLQLTLISLMHCVSLRLLPRLLDEIKSAIDGCSDLAQKSVLLDETLQEIQRRVGDKEKEVCMTWWDGKMREFGSTFQHQARL
ncbi:hypothetical protein SISSUDRAFT_1043982 [Sistotremastrum suecicum HHB10207 ss-3]|uniref:Uncharacterized protein n=1 Tax=Sistotremastrum suecicum HHB10207 ss-3 TaxID=1314776 RepID=A0A166FHL5_9AGAM|nr:hypothetical protein SISSUDRAFT_1043982 [Sistotremastrum suecicum HHB10207 ss-3]